jgi:hypothetical protein
VIDFAVPVIGRAFARPVGSTHPMLCYARYCAETNHFDLIALSTALQRRFAELSTMFVVQMT